MATFVLDLGGLKCPLPVLRTRKALARLHVGDRLDVRCTDPLAAIDIPHLVGATGNRLIDFRQDAAELAFLIEIESI